VFIKLAILFITIPICEIFIFLEAGNLIGPLPTLATVILTGIAGAYLARTQGLELVAKVQKSLNRGELPSSELLDGLFILAGGLLLLTPGLLTDLVGFVCLTPLARQPLKKKLGEWFANKLAQGEFITRRH